MGMNVTARLKKTVAANKRVLKASTVLLLAALAVFPVASDEIKIGFVDGVRLIEQAPQGDAAKSALENEFKPREKQILAIRERIRELEELLNPVDDSRALPDDDILQTQRDLRDARRDLNRMQQEMREDLNLRRNEELAKLQRLISNTIVEIARQENFDLIIQDAVYASKAIDITDRVLDQLKTGFESGN